MFGDCQRLSRGLELLPGESDVGVAAQATGEDPGGFDRRRRTEPRRAEERTDGEAPPPALAARIVLGVADDFDDREDVLPAGGVTDREIAFLHARPFGRGVRAERRGVDAVRQDPVSGAANEEPMLHARAVLAAFTFVVVVSGCGDSSSSEPAAPPPGKTESGTTTAATTTVEALPDAGFATQVGRTTAKAIALLDRVAVGRHEGYDRVVFQFATAGVPGYRVEYVDPPLKEDGSGNPVDVEGNAFVVARMEPASGFDLNTGDGVLVYKGPKRLPGASIVKEVVRTGDFEAVLSWAIGLGTEVPFRVTTAESPSRLIVDFKND
jgi:hypothetical protein